MTHTLEIYKCHVCGNVVEIYDQGLGELICCGQVMQLMPERAAEAATEMHVPFAKLAGGRLVVRVGLGQMHPMDPKHHIQWIEVITGETILRQPLAPGQVPEASFQLGNANVLNIRAFCNLHGLWVTDQLPIK